MLHYDRIDISEEIDVNKTSASKECDIYHYWYFLNKGCKFQPNVCNRYHELLIMSMKLSDTGTLNIKGYDYSCIINRIIGDYCCVIFGICVIFGKVRP